MQDELAAAQEQRAAAAQQHAEAEAARSSLQERLAASEASLAESQLAAQQAQQQHQEAAAAAAELREQLSQAQQQVAAAGGERLEWGQQRGELQQQVAALQKAQSIADGKLVLARQREAQFKVWGSPSRHCSHPCMHVDRPPPLGLLAFLGLSMPSTRQIWRHSVGANSVHVCHLPCPLAPPLLQEASQQLRVLQQELKTFVAEGHAHRQKREAAEQRYAVVHCAVLPCQHGRLRHT